MRLLLTGAVRYTDEQKKVLSDLGHEILYVQDERIPLSQQGIDASQIEGVICNGLFLYNELSAFENLRYVQLTSVGFDRVPLEELQQRGVVVHNARGVYSAPMAEYALCGVLQLYKHSNDFARNQRVHLWEKMREIRELFGKTVCIVGCGSVGQACAKRFAAFDCRVIGVDPAVVEAPYFERLYPTDWLDDVLTQSDIVVLTVPLTAETIGVFSAQRLALMKPDAVLVNISRGTVVNEQALITGLQKGALGGAVLDVFENEPLAADSPLWDMPNVILTPHNSFVGEGNNRRLFDLIVKNLGHEGTL